ncbi:tyrosine-type recombinase/integrase [Mesorhizobium sp. AR02]|uniref:tyrosine-type recombinase/integrase n=1 Tax=Mesorhizobium sp. AR02 TaxID=2865837 RepID=UPI002160F7C7|nr:tyrosine-type recombinase/integrase [Mesorhizobium sp. AR02]UVK56341.1 tyrosine-type recombinase/integrase [Mesorhizobium sp. AR02]
MANQRQYLEWHGQQWRVRVKVPARVRDLIGRGKLTHPLHTADLKDADVRKWPIVSRLKGIIAAAEKAFATNDPLEAEALRHRLSMDDEGTQYAINLRAHQIEETNGLDTAKAFFALASGQVTPLDHHATEFLKHQGYRLKSEGDFRRVLGWLGDWLRDSRLPVALEAVRRVDAGKFLSESLLVGRGRQKATAYLGFIRQYWTWLLDKGHLPASENPWAGQRLPAERRQARDAETDRGKRPFTDTEMTKLLNGDGGPLLNDLMPIGALSGMRIEEICQLHASDCRDEMFSVWAGKTDNARRTVPIHSGLKEIVRRRTEGKKDTDYLFADLPPIPKSRETRSDPAAKQFTRYRRKVGVDERPNDKAKSNVDFHSFRRWFIRKARDAKLAGAEGFDEWTITWVVGHTDSDRAKSLDLSQHGYAGMDREEAKRALVEAVKLPLENLAPIPD